MQATKTGTCPYFEVLLTQLKECSITEDLKRGKQLHEEAIASGHVYSNYIASALINMYAKCSSMVNARQVFDSVERPNVVSWNALILGYADNGQGLIALEMFSKMGSSALVPNPVTFKATLKACASLKEAYGCGKKLHMLAVEYGCESNTYVQRRLIEMYVTCSSMVDARQVFDSIEHPDVLCWTMLIMGYADNGQGLTALNLFTNMQHLGPVPDSVTFVASLKACISLACKHEFAECRYWGIAIHNLTVENGDDSDIYVQNTLIDMYAKCHSTPDGHQVFQSMKHRDVVSWTALILGYANNGQGLTALDMFKKMKTRGPSPNSITFVAAIKACTSLKQKDGFNGQVKWKDWGKAVQNLVIEHGCESNLYVQSTLIDMYSKLGNMVCARHLFDSAKHPDVVSWTALILGYAEAGKSVTALDLFTRFKGKGHVPDYVTLMAALKACSLVGALEFGRTVHLEIDTRNQLNMVLVTCLVDFYAKCGSLVEAQSLFHLHAEKADVITWNAMLSGFSSCGDHESMLTLFKRMQDAGLQPDSVTFLSILTCCSHRGLVVKGKECFDTMSTTYGIIPSLEHYNCMVDNFARANKLDDGMALLDRMPWSPDEVTWTSILGACRKWKNLQMGRLAFQSLINLDSKNLAGYVLMGQIYGSRGMLQEQDIVMALRRMEI